MSQTNIESMLDEKRVFEPPFARRDNAHVRSMEQYRELCSRADEDPEGFWAERAVKLLDWFRPFDSVLDADMQQADIRWFSGGRLNVAYNCIDRHLTRGKTQQGGNHLAGRAGRGRACVHVSDAAR